ncbi:MAG TPA: 3-hydroxyacyl-ACP dehydratase FabZ family protein [Phycisphaerae bacterium]|nr:3-hydroxyacyl-ACP dehydratase FabZ family protein [Phycisphaerae bacterium]HNU44366.1 3-hydroxyacyl-ACP dehydratase FabZ family protein [Phycisphaerae bacterium]
MKFCLLDRIVEFTAGQRIVAVKAVTLAEEYLADHFPTFPVLPGVMMLEALVEAATCLVWDGLDFAPSVVLLREAKNVTYRSFVRPGDVLRVEVTCSRLAAAESDFAGVGSCGGAEVVKGRFGLRHFSLAERDGGPDSADRKLRQAARERFAALRK